MALAPGIERIMERQVARAAPLLVKVGQKPNRATSGAMGFDDEGARRAGVMARCHLLHRFLMSESARLHSFDKPFVPKDILAVLPINSVISWFLFNVDARVEQPDWFATARIRNKLYGDLTAYERGCLWGQDTDDTCKTEVVKMLVILKKLGLVRLIMDREVMEKNKATLGFGQDPRRWILAKSAYLERPARTAVNAEAGAEAGAAGAGGTSTSIVTRDPASASSSVVYKRYDYTFVDASSTSDGGGATSAAAA